jgi:hypothetical protein
MNYKTQQGPTRSDGSYRSAIAPKIAATDIPNPFSLSLNNKIFIFGAIFTLAAGITYYLLHRNNSDTQNSAKKASEAESTHTEAEPDSSFFANDADVSDLGPLQAKSPLVGRHGTFQPSNASTASNCSEIPQSSQSNGSSYDVVDHDDAEADYDPTTKFTHPKSPIKPAALQPVVQATVQPAPRKESACLMM